MNPEENQFFYQLIGLDPKRHPVETPGKISFPSLPNGRYKLLISGTNAFGKESENQLTINLYIRPLFYKTWYFIVGVIILMVAPFLWFWKVKLTQKLQLDKLRNTISSDLHDEIGTSLARTYFLLSQIKDQNQEGSTLPKAMLLVKAISSNIRDFSWAIDDDSSTIKHLKERMDDFAYDTLAKAEILYKIQIEPNVSHLKLNMQLRQNLIRIYKEAINNILKHSNADRVIIKIRILQNQLHLSIVNNNPFHYDKKTNSGIGLKNMELRTKKLKGSFRYHHSQDSFVVEIACPLHP